MKYQLPPELHERIKVWMSAGDYESESVRDALDALEDRQTATARWHETNRLAIEQSERGESKPLDADAILDRLHKRLAQQQASQ